ncbi:MAG: carboxypeptidase-like regulatory domain-containing protein [Terriglobales bacterium]
MNLSGKLRLMAVCFGLLLLACAPGWGQATSTGAVIGQVTDQSGAAIPGAQIRMVEKSTSTVLTTLSNDAGRYFVADVAPGTYDVTVTKTGFAQQKVVQQEVQVGLSLTLNVTLQVGSAATVVEVKAEATAELQTLSSTVGSTLNSESIQLLPNLGRDASSLSVLQVGVAPTGNVAGAAADQNVYQLDGGNNSDDMAGTNTTYTPGNGYIGTGSTGGTPTGVIPTPIESIEQFKIGTANQTADFNGAAGSQVQMVTKRGTNVYHGSLYEFYFANNVGAANLWKNNHTPNAQAGTPYTPLPATHRNRYGGAVGGPLTPRFWGGKTYFFANYEGMRYPNTVTFERGVPTELLKMGVLKLPNSAGVVTAYNMNPFPVTLNGATYQPAQCGGQNCDPRGIGINSLVRQVWNQLPLPNDPQFVNSGNGIDGINAQGYLGSLSLPQSSNFFVTRIDHDFGDKWKFMASYRYYSYLQQTNNQTTLSASGQYTATAPRPQKPSYLVGGLTGQLTPNLTNDFRVSYLRNFWQWSDLGGVPQVAGLGGALEMGGESAALNALIPTNVNSQSTRQRFWDGHDYFYRDDLSLLHNNHLFQFGGSYQRNFDFHSRNDNGVGIDTSITYQIANGSGIPASAYPTPTGLASSQASNFSLLYSEVLGIVGQSQVMYTRSGANLTLDPLGGFGFDKDIIPTYDFYFTDTWHMKPTFTLTYGMAYTLAMPPYETGGKQVMLVNDAGTPIDIDSFLAARQKAALAGQGFAPEIGFATIRNVGGGLKYPYNPFYGGFSPRVSAAWNPNFDSGILGSIIGHGKTVVRGGYARIYGRTNGVDLVLVPLLGPGPLQAVSCFPSATGQCANASSLTPTTAFRIGTDGNAAPLPAVSQTFPQPYFPGVGGNAAAADGSGLDPKFRPNHSDEFNFTIQRALSNKAVLEVGYIGRKISNEFQEINTDAVPFMTTLGGQSFAQAYANVYTQLCGLSSPICANNASAVTAQPFFEAALGGPNSGFCTGSANCTAAVVSKLGGSIRSTQVYSLWQSLSSAQGWTLGRTLLSSPALGTNIAAQLTAFELITSKGYGNYNAAFARFSTKGWHGLTTISNFTWGRALGTASVNQATSSATVPNPWDLSYGYGPQPFDIRFVYSMLVLYQPPMFKSQHGVAGHLLGGWAISPLFTAQSGAPNQISVGSGGNRNAQSFGESYGNSNTGLYENAVGVSPFTGGNSAHDNVHPTCSNVASSGSSGINLFADPCAIYAEFRPPILGIDTNTNGNGPIRGFPTWNLDATVSKDIRATERFSATLTFQVVNVLNHFQPSNPGTNMNITSPQTWGVVSDQNTTANGAQSRWMEFGLRIRF